jgi:hypothetical protein
MPFYFKDFRVHRETIVLRFAVDVVNGCAHTGMARVAHHLTLIRSTGGFDEKCV